MSSWKSPWGSVGEASMSPRRSVTTNVLPSRMPTVSVVIRVPPRDGRIAKRCRAVSPPRAVPGRRTSPRRKAVNRLCCPDRTAPNSSEVHSTRQSGRPVVWSSARRPWCSRMSHCSLLSSVNRYRTVAACSLGGRMGAQEVAPTASAGCHASWRFLSGVLAGSALSVTTRHVGWSCGDEAPYRQCLSIDAVCSRIDETLW